MNDSTRSSGGSIGRFSIGLNVLLQVGIGLFLFGVVNYLGWRTHKRWDLSIGKSHTLSDRTVNFLESMEKRVRIIVLFTRGTQLTANVHDLVEEYKRHGGKKVKLEFIDPAREPNRLESVKDKHGFQFADRKDGILIEMKDADGTLRTKFISEDAFSVVDPSTGRTMAFTGESALTSGLLALTEGRKRVLKLVTGKGGLKLGPKGSTAMDFLLNFARKENAEVRTIDISDPNADLQAADLLVFINIKVDLTEDEVKRVRDYWESKRGAMLILLNPEFDTPNLHALLKDYGIIARDDRVLEVISGPRPLTGWEVASVSLAAEVTDQWGTIVKFRDQTQSLEIDHLREEELKGRGIVVHELLQADDRRFWGETDYLRDPPVYNDKEDSRRGPVTGVYAEMGVAQDAKLRGDSSRMVVLGNATMLDPEWDTASYDLGTSSINWMLDRDELIGIAPKEKQWFRLEISDIQSRRMFQIIIIALPLSVICFGLFVWSMRRA